jgi:hypothetical protein
MLGVAGEDLLITYSLLIGLELKSSPFEKFELRLFPNSYTIFINMTLFSSIETNPFFYKFILSSAVNTFLLKVLVIRL